MFQRSFLVRLIASIMLGMPTAGNAAPAFYHWYHPYDQPMSWCSELVGEAATNLNVANTNIDTYQSTVRMNGARGIMRCLSRGSGQSWVVIIAYADSGEEAFELFDLMRLVICGACSDLWE